MRTYTDRAEWQAAWYVMVLLFRACSYVILGMVEFLGWVLIGVWDGVRKAGKRL